MRKANITCHVSRDSPRDSEELRVTLNLLDDIVTTCDLGEERQGRAVGHYKGGGE